MRITAFLCKSAFSGAFRQTYGPRLRVRRKQLEARGHMCGIVGAVAERNVVPILMEGLRRLEYRGYDSAGIAVLNGSEHLTRLRTVGKVRMLDEALEQTPTARQDRHRPHALGHARRAERAQCPPAHLARRTGDRAQRHHREPRGAARRPRAPRLPVLLGNGHRGHRPPHPLPPADRAGPVQGRARHGRGARGRLRARGGE